MVYAINIVTNTRSGDAYDRVAINPYPIIYIGNESVEDVLRDDDLLEVLRGYIKNETTYNKASLMIRSVDGLDVCEYEYPVSNLLSMIHH